jgi:RimJ/RimL family protein N-acetyltransferase
MLSLRKVTFEDWPLLLEWRNDEETRNNSHTTALVAEESHKNWLKHALEDSGKQLYIAEEDEIPVGTVRADFDEALNDYLLSWTTSPDARGKGTGKRMVKTLVDLLNTRIRAEIKSGNTASVKIAEFAGLTLKKEDNRVLYFSNY